MFFSFLFLKWRNVKVTESNTNWQVIHLTIDSWVKIQSKAFFLLLLFSIRVKPELIQAKQYLIIYYYLLARNGLLRFLKGISIWIWAFEKFVQELNENTWKSDICIMVKLLCCTVVSFPQHLNLIFEFTEWLGFWVKISDNRVF